MPLFKSQKGRTSEEKEGLIGEGFWELTAGQQGRSRRRKDEVRDELDGLRRVGGRPDKTILSSFSGESLNTLGLRRMN